MGDEVNEENHDGSQRKTPIDQSSRRRTSRGHSDARQRAQGGRPYNQPQGPRPEHPSGAATLLIIGVTLLIFLIAALSTFSGR